MALDGTSPYALAGLAASAGLAVLAILLGLAARPGERGWGLDGALRLERLSAVARPRPVSAGAHPRAGGRGPFPGTSAPRPMLRVATAVLWAGGGALLGLVLFHGPLPAALLAGAAASVALARARASRAAERRKLQEGLESALEVMAAALRAGRNLVGALEEAASRSEGPLGSILDGVVAADRAGRSLGSALGDMARSSPLPELAYLGACLQAHARTGGDVTALLINLGGVLRERRRLGRDLEAKTAEARSTATLLALLPLGMGLYILWAGPEQLAPLLGSVSGLAALGYALLSWLAGVVVIRRMLSGLTRQIEGG